MESAVPQRASPLILTPVDVEALDAKFASLTDQWDSLSQCSHRRVGKRGSAGDSRETPDGPRSTTWFVSWKDDDQNHLSPPDLHHTHYNSTSYPEEDWDDESISTVATSVAGERYPVDSLESDLEYDDAAWQEEDDILPRAGHHQGRSGPPAVLPRSAEPTHPEPPEDPPIPDVDADPEVGHYRFNEELWRVKTTPEMERLSQQMKNLTRRDDTVETTEHMTSSSSSSSSADEEEETSAHSDQAHSITTITVVEEHPTPVQQEEEEEEEEEAKVSLVSEPETRDEARAPKDTASDEVIMLSKEFDDSDDDEPAVDLLEDEAAPPCATDRGDLGGIPVEEETPVSADFFPTEVESNKVSEEREKEEDEALNEAINEAVEEPAAVDPTDHHDHLVDTAFMFTNETTEKEAAEDDKLETTEMVLSDSDDELDEFLHAVLDDPEVEEDEKEEEEEEEAIVGEASVVQDPDFYSKDSVLFLCRGLSKDIASDESWNQDLARHDAAIKIQYWWLDLAIKQALRESQQIDIDIDNALCECSQSVLSATIIQSFVRMILAQRMLHSLKANATKVASVTKIQASWRMRHCQSLVASSVEVLSATKIQSVCRMARAKEALQSLQKEKVQTRSATKIQSLYRKNKGRQMYQSRETEARQVAAATQLQSFCRMVMTRRTIHSSGTGHLRTLSATKIQSLCRTVMAKEISKTKKENILREQSATKIQFFLRQSVGKNRQIEVKEADHEEVDAATQIQSFWRIILAKRSFQKFGEFQKASSDGKSDESSNIAPGANVFFGGSNLTLTHENDHDVIDKAVLNSSEKSADFTDDFLAEIEELQSELASVYSQEQKESCQDEKDQMDARVEDADATTQADKGNTDVPSVVNGDFPLLSSNWFDKYKDDCLWDEESVLSANTAASAPAQSAAFWDDASVTSSHSAATAPVPSDLVISIYAQRAEQLTEEEVYSGAMQAVELAKEIETLMAKTRGRRPRRQRQRMAFFRVRRQANETKGKQKQKRNTKCERRKRKAPVKATANERVQPRDGIRGRISRIFRRGKDNELGTRPKARKAQRKEGGQCRAETLLTE